MSERQPPSLLDAIGRDVAGGALEGRVGVLPGGSVEYHGPNAPLGTDTFIARELAARVAAQRPRLIVLPELAYTPCPADTRDAAGTIAIASPIAAELLEQVLRSLLRAGLAGVVVMNAHEGNVEPVRSAADAVGKDHPEAFVALLSWWETLPADETARIAGFTENGGHGHAGPLELSVTKAIVGELVRPEGEVDAEKGRELLELACERLVASIDRLLAR
jgi:creatinine amidohydrolase